MIRNELATLKNIPSESIYLEICSGLKLYPGWLGQEIEKIKVYMLIQIGTIVIVHVTANVQNVFAIIYGHRPTRF